MCFYFMKEGRTKAWFFWSKAGPVGPTTDDEVRVEDAQGGLVGALLIVDGG